MMDNILKGAKILLYVALAVAVVTCSTGIYKASTVDVFAVGRGGEAAINGEEGGIGAICVGKSAQECKDLIMASGMKHYLDTFKRMKDHDMEDMEVKIEVEHDHMPEDDAEELRAENLGEKKE